MSAGPAMSLHCLRIAPPDVTPETPWLVLLHGLLGRGDDWQALCPLLPEWPILQVDLPSHGASTCVRVRDFSEMRQQLALTLCAQGITRYWLIGYSLGGRIAMDFAASWAGEAAEGLRGLLVEGGNPGVQEDTARQARMEHDARWAWRFRHEPLSVVLADWYRRGVFADLDDETRQTLVSLRSHNDAVAVADMLEATSLGRQPWLLDAVRRRGLPFGYLCGAQDQKFQAIAQTYRLPLLSVARAGHNAHRANPAAYAQQIRRFITLPDAAQAQG
ncbi:2-succinyl-6-hydroxy-2,4-cyclohexadiene-1-carboxylate synthase [Symbiopectobacterium sp. RP]|uniref:2-succinyl-6-hydroxy-2, 4-cyclohexadiene-1-carboxylate synthase n=1 Tax=Symbiopectobacterium sp. RP TaxID=3248553 RepID=UPI003D2CBDDB